MRKLVVLLLIALCLIPYAHAEEEFQEYETKYFTLDVPAGWTKTVEDDGDIYFYENHKRGITKGEGMMMISEISFEPTSETDISLRDRIIDDFFEKEADIYDLEQNRRSYRTGWSTDIVDGDQRMYFYAFQYIYDMSSIVRAALYVVPSEGYGMIIAYTHGQVPVQREFSRLIYKGLKYKGDSSPKEVHESGLDHDFGAVAVSVVGYKMIKQGDQDCLVVEYQWMHQGDEPTAFAYTFETEAYQNGIQCHSKALYDDETEVLTKIQKGAVFTCYDVFSLRDTTSPVTLRIHPFTDFFDKYEPVEYVFKLSE